MSILSKENFEKEISQGLVALEISGGACAGCIALLPVLKEAAAKREDLRVMEIDLESLPEALFEEWKIVKVPTVLLLDNGSEFARCAGYQPEEILEIWLDAKIEGHCR